MSKKVLVPIATGTEEIETACIIDTLRRAQADVTVASVGDITITASRGLKITADCLISDCINETFNLIALPGGMPGAGYLRDCDVLIKMLKDQISANRLYAAICASPAVVLAHHGLLKNKKATCYPSAIDQLPDSSSANQIVVVDGNCITSQGPATALPFALKLVEMLFSLETAKNIANAMLVNDYK